MPDRCDVLVIGGGPAGSSLATRLRRKGIDVVMATSLPSHEHLRETLSPATLGEMAWLGVDTQTLRRVSMEAYGIEAYWGTERSVFHSHVLDPPFGHGFHVDRGDLQRWFHEVARAEGVRVLEGLEFHSATRHGNRWRIAFTAAPELIETAFAVDATGRSARVARSMGRRREQLDFLCCVGATVPSDSVTASSTLRIEAAPYGWWYVAPNGSDHSFVGLVSDADILRSQRAQDGGAWARLFTGTTLARGGVTPPHVESFACSSSRLDQVSGEGWLAVGDAAATFDPLSSLGVVHALVSARQGCNTIANFLSGTSEWSREYDIESRRIFDAYQTTRASHYALERRWPRSPFWARRVNRESVARFKAGLRPSGADPETVALEV